jgi:hypothetical protein
LWKCSKASARSCRWASEEKRSWRKKRLSKVSLKCSTVPAQEELARAAKKADASCRPYVFPRQVPERNAGSLRALVQEAALAEVASLRDSGNMPTTNRFLYYRLIAQGGAFVKGSSLEGAVSDVTTDLREAQIIGMDEIRDRSRGSANFSWPSVSAYVESAAKHAKLDRVRLMVLMVWRKESAGVWGIAREFLSAEVPAKRANGGS